LPEEENGGGRIDTKKRTGVLLFFGEGKKERVPRDFAGHEWEKKGGNQPETECAPWGKKRKARVSHTL